MRYKFDVTMIIPDTLDRASVQAYVADAVATMMGCYHPASPILQATEVVVKGRGLEPVRQEIGYSFYDPDFDR